MSSLRAAPHPIRRRLAVPAFCRTVLFLIAGALTWQGAQAQALEQVVRVALDKHPRMAELRQAVEAARAEVEIPQTSRNLQMFLEGGVGSQHTKDTGTSSLVNPALRLRKMVHDSGRTDGEVRLREARLGGVRSTLEAGQEDLALETVTAYVQVARANDTLGAAREWLEGLRAIASMTEEIQRIDRGRQFDNALAGSRVQRANAEILAHTTSLADARAQLVGLVGAPVDVVLPLPGWAPSQADGAGASVATHPRMRIAGATIEVAREQASLDRLYDRPTVSVEAFAASGRDMWGRFRPVNNLGVQFVGNVALLDGGTGAATSKASLVRMQEAERAREATEVELLTALSRLRSLLEGREDRRKSFDLAHRQAVELAARMREQFQAGRRPLVDLLSQETEIYQTRLSELGEHYDALLAQARMAHASGRLLAALRIEAQP
ncbi:MAG: TolC family protein [Hydrogenophaga sp.]|uniref:TolC family protein n=1 Tax=Hydrogenophaga sp. TaxID=1904254 RepID=UPI003D1115FB